MARMIPETCPARLPKAVARIWQQIKRIQSEQVICRIAYALDGQPRPEFLVCYRRRYVFLIAVCEAGPADVEALLQGGLFESATLAERLDLKERHRIEQFIETVVEDLERPGDTIVGIRKWILFPRVSEALIHRLAEVANWPDYFLVGRGGCASEALLNHMARFATNPLGDLLMRCLQGRFSPETSIPAPWVGPQQATQSLRASQTEFFVDFDQEAAVKRDLELSADAEEVAVSQSLRLVTGVAGCGKTLVLMLRARLAAKLNRDARILVLMHNKALRADLAARADELDPSLRIEWSTFYQWINQHMRFDIAQPWALKALIERLVAESPTPVHLPTAFLQEEFEWISDNAVAPPTRAWYLEVERVGRQRALQKSQRETVFNLYHQYRTTLQKLGKTDWPGIPQRLLRRLESGKIRPQSYDAIFIDEAQFFAPVWFACVRAALHPDHGNLFLVADPTQGFLRNGQSWNQVLGREVRGRAHRLERPYRNTRQIMEFARRFYLSRGLAESDEVNLPDDEALTDLPEGDPPAFRYTRTLQDERAVIANEVSAALERGLEPGQILVIHENFQQAKDLIRHLESCHPGQVVEAGQARDRRCIRVCTINTCTGLEAPVVIVGGLDTLFSTEADLALDESERIERIRAHTKKIFVALTRSSSRLLICHRHESTRAILSAALEPVG